VDKEWGSEVMKMVKMGTMVNNSEMRIQVNGYTSTPMYKVRTKNLVTTARCL
jgi:hypothetical protein